MGDVAAEKGLHARAAVAISSSLLEHRSTGLPSLGNISLIEDEHRLLETNRVAQSTCPPTRSKLTFLAGNPRNKHSRPRNNNLFLVSTTD